jgi:hypothetical protein
MTQTMNVHVNKRIKKMLKKGWHTWMQVCYIRTFYTERTQKGKLKKQQSKVWLFLIFMFSERS